MLCLSLTGCPTTCSPSLLAHLFVIPLEHDQLLPQGLVLTLKVHFGPGHLVQHLLQSSNVWLHGHPHGQLVLIPEGTNRSERLRKKLPVRHDCMLWGACEVSLMWQGRECTHFILKSSAASFALSMSRSVLALSREAIRIWGGEKTGEARQKTYSFKQFDYSIDPQIHWYGFSFRV